MADNQETPEAPAPGGHRDELGPPSFAARMKGCDCDACKAAHRAASSKARKGKGSSPTTARKAPSRPKKAAQARESIRTAVTDDESPLRAVASMATDHRGSGTAASESELEEFGARLLIAITGIIGLAMFRPWPELREEVAMTDEEADLISKQVAGWFAGSTMNKRHGARIVQSGGLIAAGVAVYEWGDRVAGALRTARQLQGVPTGPRPAPPSPPTGGPNVPGAASQPFIPSSPDFTG